MQNTLKSLSALALALLSLSLSASQIEHKKEQELQKINQEFLEAARNNNLEKVQNLLDQKAEINTALRGKTALTLAAQVQHPTSELTKYPNKDVIKLLLNRGADDTLDDFHGLLNPTTHGDEKEAAKILQQAFDEYLQTSVKPLLAETTQLPSVIITTIIQKMHVTDHDRECLELLVQGDCKKAEELLKKGADPNPLYGTEYSKLSGSMKGCPGRFTLLSALIYDGTNNPDLTRTKLLLRYGANIPPQALNELARIFGNHTDNAIALFLRHGAEINTRTIYSRTPLLHAIHTYIWYKESDQKDGEYRKWCLDNGIDFPAAKTERIPIAERALERIKFCLAHKADTTLADEHGKTIADYAQLWPELMQIWQDHSKAAVSKA